MKREMFGTTLALMTAVVSGVAIPLNKLFVVDIDPTVFTAMRAILIGVIFLLISLTTRSFRGEAFRKNWKWLLLIAVIGGSAAFLMFFTGLKLTTGGRGAFLHKTLPLYVFIFAYFILKERVTRKQIYSMLLMVAGTVMIFSAVIDPADLWLNPHLGDALIVGATVLWALENVIAKKAMLSGGTNYLVSFSRMFFGGLILFGVVLMTGRADALMGISYLQIGNIAISTCMLFLFVLLWYASLRFINVSKASTMLLVAPVVSVALGYLWLSEPVPLIQIAGSAVILIGAYFTARTKSELFSGI